MTWVCLVGLCLAQGAGKTEQVDPAKRLRDQLDASIAWNEFLAGPNRDRPMQPVMVHRWTNNARDPQGQGLAVIWTDRGRPMVIGSIFPWDGLLIHELESLTRESFVCRREGLVRWEPERGLDFRPVPGAPVPAAEPAARLREMKRLAEQFQVTMLGWRDDNSDRELLRQLPREFFRAKPETSDCLDGAVFGYVLGTDPEALLILDASLVDGEYQWQYAFARLTSGALEGRHAGLVVWTAEKHPQRRNPRNSWISLQGPLDREEAKP